MQSVRPAQSYKAYSHRTVAQRPQARLRARRCPERSVAKWRISTGGRSHGGTSETTKDSIRAFDENGAAGED